MIGGVRQGDKIDNFRLPSRGAVESSGGKPKSLGVQKSSRSFYHITHHKVKRALKQIRTFSAELRNESRLIAFQ